MKNRLSIFLRCGGITTKKMQTFLVVLFLTLCLGGSPAFAQFDLSGGVNFTASGGNPFNVSGSDNVPEDLTFSPDGTRMYFIGSANDRVYQFNLPTAFNITTATFDNMFSVAAQTTLPRGVAFSNDGTRMFVSGNTDVFQYTLSTAFQVNTATYSGTSYATAATAGRGIFFSPTGNRMYFTHTTGNAVNQYNLATPFDISSGVTYIGLFSFASQDTSPQCTVFSSDGTRMFMVGNNSDNVFQYNLSTAFEISTATYSGFAASITAQETSPTGVAFSADGYRMYIIGDFDREINQYNLGIYHSRQSGNWNDPNTWSYQPCGGTQPAAAIAPPAGANVIICNAHTVTLTANAICNNLTINSGGTLNPAGFNLNVNGTTVVNGSFLDGVAGGTSTFAGTLTVNSGGSFTSTAISTFNFRDDITTQSGATFNLGNGNNYSFTNNPITITPNANMTFGGASGAGGAVTVSSNLTILEGAGNVTLSTNVSGINIAVGAIFLNQNQGQSSPTTTDLLTGSGSFLNSMNAYLNYTSSTMPSVSVFNVSSAGSTVWYNGSGSHNIRNVAYHNLRLGNARTLTLTAPLTVDGNLELLSGVTFDVGAVGNTVDIKGVLLSSGSSTITHRNGTFTFTGGNASLLSSETDAVTLFNVTINKTLFSNIVSFNNPLTVLNTLTLTSGRMQLVNGDNLTLTNATPANQILPATPTSSSYIVTGTNSAVIRQSLGAATYTFPVGDATNFQPCLITNPNTTASVRFGTPTATVPTLGLGSWFVSNGSVTSTVRFNDPQGGSIVNLISLVGKYESAAWTAMTGTTYPTATDYSVSNVFTGSTVEFGIFTTNSFRTTWTVAGGNIVIPTTGIGYNYNIAWRNLTSPGINEGGVTGQTGSYTITGLTNGHNYRVHIAGSFPRIFFNNAGDRLEINTIEQWGNIAWSSMENAFWGCSSLQLTATDSPNLSGVTNMLGMFRACTAFTGNASMNSWNTSTIQNMNGVFYQSPAFNQPIGSWNTSAVTNMGGMFYGATAFNQNISGWNTAAVTNMGNMFSFTANFNQNIGSWNTIAVTNMGSMFFTATAFNQNISGWNTAAVTNMGSMFADAVNFNQNIGGWNTSLVTDMSFMFFNASSFNQNLGTWTLNVGVNLTNMLDNCGMNIANYDATLTSWAATAPNGRSLGAVGRTYCTATAARNTLTTTKTWTITGDSNACPTFSAVGATNITATSFTANWTSLVGATSYDIEVSTTGSFTGTPTQTGITSTNSVRTAVANTIYYYRVRRGTPTTGAWSNTKMVSTILPAGSGNLAGFDGTGGRKIEITDNTVANFTDANTFTLEAWIKINALGTDMHVISKRTGTQGYALWVNTTGRLSVIRNVTANNGTTTLPTNAWTHVAVVFSAGGGFTTYINGVTEATIGGTTITATSQNLTIGSRPDNTFPFNGQIDEVKVWNTARTVAQIRASMCAKLTGTENGLVAYFRLDENTGTVTENKAYTATVDGTLVSSPTWATSGAPLGDVSANTYGGSTLTLTNIDVMTANGFTGAPAGVHLYKVNAPANATAPPASYNSLYNNRYFGLFFAGGTAPKANIVYNYTNNSSVGNANALRFARRNDNSIATWTANGGVINRNAKILALYEQSAGELILANRNNVMPTAKNGGTVLSFNGINQSLGMPNPVIDNFTIEFWMRTSQAGIGDGVNWHTGARLVSSNLTGGGNNDYGISVLNGKLAFGTGSTTIQSTTTVNNGTWYHIAVSRVRSTGALTISINGGKEVITGTSTNTNSLNASANISVGSRNNVDFRFNGLIDELRFWDIALPANNISNWVNLRANNEHPNIADLVAYYRFDENSGTITEELINGVDATLTSATMWATANQPLGDGAFQRITVNTPNQVANFSSAGVQISFSSPTVPNGDVVVTRIDANPDSYPTGALNFINIYWSIRNYGTNQTFSFLNDLRFDQPNGTVVGAAAPGDIQLFKRPSNSTGSGSWAFVEAADYFYRFGFGGPTTIDDFSEFVIGSPIAPLPLTLLGFKGERVKGQNGEKTEQVRLEWTTAQEINNKGFEVEMSENLRDFTKVGFVDGKATVNGQLTTNNYQLAISNANDAYYRLKQIDLNGQFKYSSTIFVAGIEATPSSFKVYPNPTQEVLYVELDNQSNQTKEVEIYNAAGVLVKSISNAQQRLTINVNDWSKGLYFVKIGKQTKRFIVE